MDDEEDQFNFEEQNNPNKINRDGLFVNKKQQFLKT